MLWLGEEEERLLNFSVVVNGDVIGLLHFATGDKH